MRIWKGKKKNSRRSGTLNEGGDGEKKARRYRIEMKREKKEK